MITVAPTDRCCSPDVRKHDCLTRRQQKSHRRDFKHQNCDAKIIISTQRDVCQNNHNMVILSNREVAAIHFISCHMNKILCLF